MKANYRSCSITRRVFGAVRAGMLFCLAVTLPRIAESATIDFTTYPTVGFNNTSQLWSSTGVFGLVDAAHFGNDAEADVTANGITFVSRGASSPHFSIPTSGTTSAPAAGTYYSPSTHAAGYMDIIGMSAGDEALMLDSLVFGLGANNSLVRLSDLTIGHDYVMQLLLVLDNGPASGNNANVYYANVTAPPFYGPFDWADDRAWIVTGAFTADATTQDFRVYAGGVNNAIVNAYLLYDVTAIPEPSSLSTFGLMALTACGCGWWMRRRMK